MSHGWFAALAFAGAFGFYLLLAGSLSGTELAAAVPAAAAVAAFMTIQRLHQSRPIALTWPPPRMLLGTLASLVTDSGRVGLALLRAIAGSAGGAGGSASWQPFHPGGHSPRDAGRRGLVTLLTSVAPNGFVLDLRPSGLPAAGHGLLLHRLAPSAELTDADWPA